MMCHRQRELVAKKFDRSPTLLVAKKFQPPECQSTIDGQAAATTMSDTAVITVAVDSSLIRKSRTNQWPGARKGIESVMFTYRFMEDRPGTYRTCDDQDLTTMFTEVQESKAMPSDAGHGAINVPQTDEGQTTDGFARTADREVMVCARGGRGHAALCPEAQLMAGNYVIYLNDEGPVKRLLQWVAGICAGRDHAVYACPEAQLMADCPVIHLNDEGPIGWLLR